MSSCSELVAGMGGVHAMVLGRKDIKFITLAVRKRGGACVQPDTGISNMMKTFVFLLHWSDSLP